MSEWKPEGILVPDPQKCKWRTCNKMASPLQEHCSKHRAILKHRQLYKSPYKETGTSAEHLIGVTTRK